jgi:hypothetical protein
MNRKKRSYCGEVLRLRHPQYIAAILCTRKVKIACQLLHSPTNGVHETSLIDITTLVKFWERFGSTDRLDGVFQGLGRKIGAGTVPVQLWKQQTFPGKGYICFGYQKFSVFYLRRWIQASDARIAPPMKSVAC